MESRPWSAKQASTAASDIFKLWRASQPSSPKGKEYAQIINGVREFIEVHGADFSDSEWLPEQDDKTSRIVNLEPVIRKRAGYWNDLGAKRIYMFNADGVKRASGTFTTRKVIEVLKTAGAISGPRRQQDYEEMLDPPAKAQHGFLPDRSRKTRTAAMIQNQFAVSCILSAKEAKVLQNRPPRRINTSAAAFAVGSKIVRRHCEGIPLSSAKETGLRTSFAQAITRKAA
jgi:hypothetical protein